MGSKKNVPRLTPEMRASIRADLAIADDLSEKRKHYTIDAIAKRHGVTKNAIIQYKTGLTYNGEFLKIT